MSNARVLVKPTGRIELDAGGYLGWGMECSECGSLGSDGHRYDDATGFAQSHAAACLALRLARLREQITDTAAMLKDWSATSPDDNAFTRGANMAYAVAAKVLTERTGVTP